MSKEIFKKVVANDPKALAEIKLAVLNGLDIKYEMNEAAIRDKVKVNGISFSDKDTALNHFAKKTGFWKDSEDFEKDYHKFINDEKLQGVSRTTLAKFLNIVKMENSDDYHKNPKAFSDFEVAYKQLHKLK